MDPVAQAFSSIWVVICGIGTTQGNRPRPEYIAAVSYQQPSNVVQIGAPKLFNHPVAPYPTGPQGLLVTFDANELVACHLALGWRVPDRIVDLAVEYRNATNGATRPCGPGLVGALLFYGEPPTQGIDGSSAPAAVARRLLAICNLFDAMRPTLDLGRALLRGRHMCAVARIEAYGVPVDRARIELLRVAWPEIHQRVFELTDQSYGVFKGTRFLPRVFEDWLAHRGIDWPRTSEGRLELSDGTFRDMARRSPEIRPLKEILTTLSCFDPHALKVGRDGYNRPHLRPFSSCTGRNQPSSKASVLGSAAWVRNLVRPAPGHALALIDWGQQEFGIAAALSQDAAMMAAYVTGDPYMAFAVMAGAAPADANAATHHDVRERFKACMLGVQYGMGAATLARITGLSPSVAQHLMTQHRSVFGGYWRWSSAVENEALLSRQMASVFGWSMRIRPEATPGLIRNFPMQANGAEMLRLACCLATERGIRICAPLHDAVLIETPRATAQEAIEVTSDAMAEASSIVLDGFTLRTTCRVIDHPQSLGDQRGAVVWKYVEQAIDELKGKGPQRKGPVRQRHASRARAHSRPIYLYGSKKEDGDASA